MIFLSNTTATMLALLVVRKGFVYRSEHTLGRRDHSSFLGRLRDLRTATFPACAVFPALYRYRSPRAPLMRPTKRAGNGVLWCRSIAPMLLGIGLVRAPAGRGAETG